MKIAKETWIILAIGIADLATTILFIKHHGASEAIPLFKRYWEMGLTTFVLAKFALLVGPLYVLEWARNRNPKFVSWALRGGIAAYVVMYGVGYVRLNKTEAGKEDSAPLVIQRGIAPPHYASYIRHRAVPSRRASAPNHAVMNSGAVTVY